MYISKASTSDLERIAELEEKCFPDKPYPRFFFTQAREIYAETLLVATSSDKNLAGYILAAPDSTSPNHWWILSMAVDPDMRGKGVGKSMLTEMLAALERLGANTVYLSVSEENTPARKLYDSFDFKLTRRNDDYFGKNEDRLILKLGLTQESPATLKPEELLSEAGISVSFSSVIFAVSAAILALISPRNDVAEFSIPLMLVTLSMLSSFYSVLFYANASGSLSRIHDHISVTKPLRYGNSVSEYLGIYPLVCAFPILVHFVTENLSITFAVAIINYIGFIFYQFSEFDLLSRVFPQKIHHTISTLVIISLMVSVLLTTIFNVNVASYISTMIFLSVLILLTIFGIKNHEVSAN